MKNKLKFTNNIFKIFLALIPNKKLRAKLNCKIEETFYFKLLGENNA